MHITGRLPKIAGCSPPDSIPAALSQAFHGIVVTKAQDPALCLIDSYAVGLGPLNQPVQIPLKSLPALW